jgi:hypothetical protein
MLLNFCRVLAITSDHILELARVGHVEVFLQHVSAFCFLLHSSDHVRVCLNHALIILHIVPARGKVDEENWTVDWRETKSIAAFFCTCSSCGMVMTWSVLAGTMPGTSCIFANSSKNTSKTKFTIPRANNDDAVQYVSRYSFGLLRVAIVQPLSQVRQGIELGGVRESAYLAVLLEYGSIHDCLGVFKHCNRDFGP